MSAIASESASRARAGATEVSTVCSRSRVIDMSIDSALFSLALALADGDWDLTRFSTADDEETELLTIVEGADQRLRQPNALGADAKIPAANPTMLKQRGHGGVDGGRKHRQLSGSTQSRRVQSDEIANAVHERTT